MQLIYELLLSLFFILFLPGTYSSLDVSLLQEGVNPSVQYLLLLAQVLQRNIERVTRLLLLLFLDPWRWVRNRLWICLLVPASILLPVVLVGILRKLVCQHVVCDLVLAQTHTARLAGHGGLLIVPPNNFIIVLPLLPVRLFLYLIAALVALCPATRCPLSLALEFMVDGQKVPRYGLLQLAASSLALHRAELALVLLMLINLRYRNLPVRAAVLGTAALHLDLLQCIRKSKQRILHLLTLLTLGRVDPSFALPPLFVLSTAAVFDRRAHLNWGG